MKPITERIRSRLGRYRKSLRDRLGPRGLLFDLDAQPSSAIHLAGSNRSGTTWVSEVLNHDGSLRAMFEPFHVANVPYTRVFPGRPRPYIRPGTDEPACRAMAHRILNGQVRHPWVDRYNTQRFPRRRLIKSIHANMLLKWLRVEFPETPTLFLLRHPCAVAYSVRELRFSVVNEDLTQYFDNEALMADHLEPFRGLIRDTTDEFARLVLYWCLENYVPLRALGPDDAKILFYEELVTAPEDHVRPILKWARRPHSDEVLRAMSKPSVTSWGDHSSMRNGRNPIQNWRDHLTPAEIRTAVEILRATGMDVLYDDGPMPHPEGLRRLRPGPVAESVAS